MCWGGMDWPLFAFVISTEQTIKAGALRHCFPPLANPPAVGFVVVGCATRGTSSRPGLGKGSMMSRSYATLRWRGFLISSRRLSESLSAKGSLCHWSDCTTT